MNNEWTHFIELLESYSSSTPEKVAKLSEDLSELGSHGHELNRLVVEQREQIGVNLDQLHQSIEDFQKAAEAEQVKLSEQTQHFEDAFQNWQKTLEDAKQEASLEIQRVESQSLEMRNRLQEKAAQRQTAGRQTMEAGQQAQAQMQAQVQSFQNAMGQVRDGFSEMMTMLEQTKSEFAQEVESFTQRMQSAEQQHQADLSSALQNFGQTKDQWRAALDSLHHGSVAPFRDHLVGEIENRLDQELKDLVTKAANYLNETLRDLIEALAGHAGGAAEDRSAIKEIIDEIEYFIENLDRIAKRIVAESAGSFLGGLAQSLGSSIGIGGPIGAIGGIVVGKLAEDEVESALD